MQKQGFKAVKTHMQRFIASSPFEKNDIYINPHIFWHSPASLHKAFGAGKQRKTKDRIITWRCD